MSYRFFLSFTAGFLISVNALAAIKCQVGSSVDGSNYSSETITLNGDGDSKNGKLKIFPVGSPVKDYFTSPDWTYILLVNKLPNGNPDISVKLEKLNGGYQTFSAEGQNKVELSVFDFQMSKNFFNLTCDVE